MFHVNPLPGRGFTRNIKPYFLQCIKEKKRVLTVAILYGPLKIKPNCSVLGQLHGNCFRCLSCGTFYSISYFIGSGDPVM